MPLLALVLLLTLLLGGPARAQGPGMAPPGAACMWCGAELGSTYFQSARGQWVCSQGCAAARVADMQAKGDEKAAARAEEQARRDAEAAAKAAEKQARNTRLMLILILVPVALVGIAVIVGKLRERG